MADRPNARRVSVVVAGLMVVVGGCTGASPPGAMAPGGIAPIPSEPPVPPLSWSPCSADPAVQCGTVTVPVDYGHPQAGSLRVAVTRAPATGPNRRGALVFNPGGPGESGNQILPILLDRFPPSVRQSFDIVSFDPRGTGASQRLDCGTSPAAAASAIPVPAGRLDPLPATPLFTAMARSCRRRAPALVPFVDTVDTARDLDRIRQALGLGRLDYDGLSYGTVLGTAYAALFPHHVGRFVLDGAVDVAADLPTQAAQEAPAVESALDRLLATCSAAPNCPLGTDPASFYRGLLASLSRQPLPAPGGADPYPITVGDLDTAALLALSVPDFTPDFYSALLAARYGDGTPLRSLARELETDVDGSSLVDPLWAITCNDTAHHPGPTAAGEQASALAARYPLIGGYAVQYTLGGCVAWPAGRRPVAGVRPAGIPPVLVVGTTGDPNTPIVGARHLATLIPHSMLVTWQGAGHTWLLNGSADPCMQRVVSDYLVKGDLPPRHTRCE